MNKIYVGNLPYRTSEDQLTQHFGQYGTVDSVAIVIDRATNRSKGFGFVTFNDQASADQAVREMDGKEFEGRTIKVSIAKPPREREGGGDRGDRGDRGGRGGRGGRSDDY